MRGYIREYRPGKWSYTFYVGKNEQGKPKKIEKGGFTSKKECESVLSKKLVELDETGTVFKPSDKTLGEVWQEYYDTMRCEWAHTTARMKKATYECHLDKQLGYRYIKTLKMSDINDFLKEKIDKGLSAEYIRIIKRVLSGTMTYAVKHGYIRQNPCFGTITPKVIRKPLEVFTEDEIRRILAIYQNHDYHIFLTIAIYTGMRCGEIFGLRWSDVDFTTRTIDIQRQIVKGDNGEGFQQCKHGSNRLIHIPQQLVNYLRDLKNRQDADRNDLGDKYRPFNVVHNYETGKDERIDDLICIKRTGQRLPKSSITMLSVTCKKHGIAFHPHKLRHTYATTLLETGRCSVKMLQETLGHSSATFTLDIYSHVSKKHEESVIDKLPTY